MTSFSSAELAAMQAAQEAHMMDACTVDVYDGTATDIYNNPDPDWTPGSEIACGFRPVKVDEVLGVSDVPVIDAELRLPINTAVTPEDRITITKRHDVDVPDVTYEIVGEPKRGPSGLVLALKVVTDGG